MSFEMYYSEFYGIDIIMSSMLFFWQLQFTDEGVFISTPGWYEVLKRLRKPLDT